MWNGRIESICSWKKALHFNKKASLFNKRSLGQSRRAGGVLTPLTRVCLECRHDWFK